MMLFALVFVVEQVTSVNEVPRSTYERVHLQRTARHLTKGRPCNGNRKYGGRKSSKIKMQLPNQLGRKISVIPPVILFQL